MVSLNALLLTTALLGGAPAQDTILLHFTAEWCQPCKLMKPTIRRISNEGYPIRSVDIDTRPDLAKRFKVGPVPTFVLVHNGQEQRRVEGAVSYRELVDLLGGSRVLPDLPSKSSTPTALGSAEPRRIDSRAARQRALQASVRLRVEDADSFSFGTGTIIDVRQGNALVLTCGHIFRDSRGRGAIDVDVFVNGAPQRVSGQLITYEPDYRDIGFVTFALPGSIEPVPVAARMDAAQKGAAAFSVGCDRGDDPSIRETRLTTINRFQGAPNIEAAGAPVQGRSGGGLFNAQGELIGVCKLALRDEDEGIYSSLPSVHWHLDKLQLTHIYQRSTGPRGTGPRNKGRDTTLVDRGGSADRAQPISNPMTDPRADALPARSTLGRIREAVDSPVTAPLVREAANSAPAQQDKGFSGPRVLEQATAELADGAELICVIRRRNDPQGRSRVVVVNSASPELLRQIARAVEREQSAGVARPQRREAVMETAGLQSPARVVRGQSDLQSVQP